MAIGNLVFLMMDSLKKIHSMSRTQKLNWLALNYDPYCPPSKDILALLKEFNLDTAQEHPFDITNKLLKLLDESNQKEKIIH